MPWISGGVFEEELFFSLEATVFLQRLVDGLSTRRFSLEQTYYKQGVSVFRLRHPQASVPGFVEVSLEGDADAGWCILVNFTDPVFNRTRLEMRFYKTNGPDRTTTAELVSGAISQIVLEG